MGKVNLNDADKYKSGQGAEFFSLKNDKDVATVRFCHEGADSVEIIACHNIEVDGKKRKVSCLRSYDDPIDLCPLCAAGNPISLRYFVTLLEYPKTKNGFGEPVKKIWERGRSFQKELLGLVGRYSPLCDTVFEVERQGKAGDQQTKYGIYPMNYSLDELPISNEDLENDSVIGSIILDKTAEELDYFLENNEFPPAGDEPADRAESTSRNTTETRRPETISRRAVTPSDTDGRRRI